MNFIFSIGVLLSSVSVSVIYGQYFPHRNPVSQKSYKPISANANPFQTAYENQGYYQKFTDYGRQRGQPLTQSQNTYSAGNKGKGKEENEDNYEDGADFDFGTNLDYNDLTQEDGKDFDPFKYVKDGVAGIDQYTDIGGLGDFGDHFDYNVDYSGEK